MKKILGVSFETIDTKIVAASLAQLEKSVSCKTSILAGDPYQVNYKSARQDLEYIKTQYKIPVFTIEKCLNQQYQKKNKIHEIKHKISEWVKENKIDVPTSDLFSSDHIFSHYERSPYYNKMSEVEKLSIFLSFCEYTAAIFDENKPDFVFCIGKNYVIKNIVMSLCKSRKIKVSVLSHTRLGKNYAFYQSFFPAKNEFKASDQYLLKADSYIDKVCGKLRGNIVSGGLYMSATEKQVDKLSVNSKASRIYSEAKLIVKYTLRFFKEFRNRDWKTVWGAYSSNPFYTLTHYYLNSIRRLKYLYFGMPFTSKIPQECDFFYFPLHLRPESSILTLGKGLDDEVALEYLMRKLPKESYLVVKENPLMVSYRSKKFYRWISRQTSVILVDPLVSSYELIINSKGVIGISGTALLEAAILGKPTHAFGHPEFRDFLTSYGYDNLDNFFHLALSNNVDLNNEIYKYIAWVLENGMELTLDRSILKNDNSLNRVAKLISTSLKELSQ